MRREPGLQRLRSTSAGPLIGVAVFSLVWAFVLTSDALALRLNWDSANYAGRLANGTLGWSAPPWSSHYALGPIYWLGWQVVAPFGGGAIAGIRFLGVAALSVSAALVYLANRRLGARRSLACLWAGVYVTAWGIALLVGTFEDNLLYLPWAIGTILLCLLRLQAWRARDSVVAGGLCGLGALVSWQAGLYLFAPLYVAACLGGPGRGAYLRLREVLLVPLSFLCTLCAWVLFYAATAPEQDLRALFAVLFSRPEPSFFPESWEDLGALLRGPRRIFRHLGMGLMHEAGPLALDSRAVRERLPELGLGCFVITVLASVWTTVRGLRGKGFGPQFLCVVFLALVTATSLYVDLPSDKFKRYEFVPLFLCLAGAGLTTALVERWGTRGPARFPVARAVPVLVGLIVAAQLGLTLWNADRHRKGLPELHPPGYHGKDHEPWFVYFRRLRARTPERCVYLFTQAELAHGRYQLEIPAGLWDALPEHRVLARDDKELRALDDWRVKVNAIAVSALPPPPNCAWWSDAARALLGPLQ